MSIRRIQAWENALEITPRVRHSGARGVLLRVSCVSSSAREAPKGTQKNYGEGSLASNCVWEGIVAVSDLEAPARPGPRSTSGPLPTRPTNGEEDHPFWKKMEKKRVGEGFWGE